MEKYFCNYNQSLALKELGFDEPCIARYIIPGDLVFKGCYEDSNIIHLELTQNDICEAHVLAPLKSQVFDWFREKYNLVFNFISYNIVKPAEYYWSITWDDEAKASGIVKSYEEAESACIDKLIEIVK